MVTALTSNLDPVGNPRTETTPVQIIEAIVHASNEEEDTSHCQNVRLSIDQERPMNPDEINIITIGSPNQSLSECQSPLDSTQL